MGDLTPTLIDVLLRRAEESPDRVWTTDVFGRTLTYAETVDGARRWAAAYRRIGVGRGDFVVTMQLNSVDGTLGWLGLAWLGAVEAPINVDYRGPLLTHALNLTRARVALVLAQYADRLREVAGELEHLKTVVVPDADAFDLPFEVVAGAALHAGVEPADDLDPPAPWDLMGVLFTSGTTGPSKAVRIPWGQMHATAMSTWPIEDLGPDDVIYNPTPAYHVGAKAFPFMAALIDGRQVVRPFISLTEMGSDYLEHGVTTGVVGPMSWLAEPESPDDARRPLRNLLVPWPIPGMDEFRRRFGVRTYACFNMTEVSVPIADPDWDSTHYDEHGRMSCGKVRPGYEARVVDPHDQPLPPGEVGELIVRSDAPWVLNDGYLNMPEATAEAWRNGWFHTGDAFVYDAEGWFYFVDRIKDCIRRRSENISSFEVEAYVAAHPEVAECAAVAVKMGDDPAADEEVRVVVVRTPDGTVEAEELVRWLIPRMPRFMIPRFVDFADSLPRTPTMKVRKAELREQGVTDRTWDRVSAGVELPR
ncbi:MAG TPA: AMP-binding protein [Acidimicrobiales bacterium]|nr:AMP-binding protein [Acidimicrobiales bacterium]